MLREDLKRIVADVLEVDPGLLAPETELSAIEAFDSVSVLTLIIELDERAGIKVPPDAAGKLRRYGDIEALAHGSGVELTD